MFGEYNVIYLHEINGYPCTGRTAGGKGESRISILRELQLRETQKRKRLSHTEWDGLFLFYVRILHKIYL